ncbi:MAG: hypothetical protein B7Y26_01280 [Hydrogenophilales bacterium 16-64-46]|nr:MAG: hypothetical protein B7Z32_08835 [Hydrogenophilales bacterium 12-64-13]OYZ07250.1 MAG: hypothetical protein B7Y26_01280 [Hydrogenophilales bacterium 16-64-46]OZA37283.1 MAG: hypothetical protein B7X87_11205 [Hydrogenophilales bacterium 17-64-34]HQS98967.1 glycosyltransferase family 4 protein [Thiobacillus sp.]
MNQRILLVTPATPFSPRSGAQQRSALLHAALGRLGVVDVLLLEPGSGPTRSLPADAGVIARIQWRSRPLGLGKYRPDRQVSALLSAAGIVLDAYDLVVGRYLNTLCKLQLPAAARTVVDLDDWAYQYSAGGGSFSDHLKSAYAAWLARRQLGRFNAFFVVSPRDAASLSGLTATVLPNIPFAPPSEPYPAMSSRTLLFVGALWYPPNRAGIERFLARSWPAIRAACPDAKLSLIGAAPPALRATWEQSPGVSAPGYVDDIDSAYRHAAFSIAPLHAGGGTNIKILESLAYGRACVTTPHCATAFEADLGGAGLFVAGDDQALARACVDWLSDPEKPARTAIEGHAAVSACFTRARFEQQVRRLCASAT